MEIESGDRTLAAIESYEGMEAVSAPTSQCSTATPAMPALFAQAQFTLREYLPIHT